MINYIYSANENAFYAVSLREQYEISGVWPEGGKGISDDIYGEFSGPEPQGMVRAAGGDGMPVWVNIPAPTREESVAAADAEKQRLIDEANGFMNSKQWPGKAAIGRLKGAELEQYGIWLDYLDALEALDTSSAPDISWPTPPTQ